MTPSSRSCQPVDPRSVHRCAGKKGGRFHRGRLPRLCIGTPDIEDLATRTRAVPVGFGLLSVDQHQMLPAVLAALFGFYQENLQQDQAEAQSASTIKSALRMKRWRRLFPIAKPSLLLSVACAARRAGRGNAARSRLYFVGYLTMNLNPNRNLVASGTAPGEPRRRPCFENDFTSQIFS